MTNSTQLGIFPISFMGTTIEKYIGQSIIKENNVIISVFFVSKSNPIQGDILNQKTMSNIPEEPIKKDKDKIRTVLNVITP